ncbi:MAG: LysR family transcriptional regulator, partial [Alcaligenaceae bacterium]
YERTRVAFKEIDMAVADARRQGVTHGTVRLATVHTLSYYFTAEVAASFVSANPSANLSLMGRSSPEVVALVESGKADIGFVYDSAVDTGDLNVLHLFEDEMALIVHTDSDLQGDQDLTSQALRLVGFPSHYALRRMIHRGGLSPTFVAEAETIDAMLKLVSSGVGDCILPSRIPEKLLQDYDLRMLRVIRPLLRRKVVLITNSSKSASALTSELQECAKRVATRLSGIAAMT